MEQIPNIPENPDIAIKAGSRLCKEVLEPIQDHLGRICIRSAYRSPTVNAIGAKNKNQYSCSSNERNYARHIWDTPDKDGCIGAMACIVVTSFIPYYERTQHWQALAWWIHDNVPGYSTMCFFPKLAAFNISWHENPEKRIDSYVAPKGGLTKVGEANFSGDHTAEYGDYLAMLSSPSPSF